MSRRGCDAVIAGAGVVGATLALGLARRGLRVAVLDAQALPDWQADAARDLRVFALAPGSSDLFGTLGVWDDIRAARAQPYRAMRVWDAGHASELHFRADALALDALGHIVEQSAITHALHAALARERGVELRVPAQVESLQQTDEAVTVETREGDRIAAAFAVACDGADSTLRKLAGLEVATHDYHQRGVVAYVECAQSHQDTAWQRFLPGGPLALLPCSEGLGSIVWTLPEREAERLLALDDAAFEAELTRAFDARLGAMRLRSKRAAFPLRRQLATRYVQGRVLLAGDAAHVVHPLAGQGVNLGLRDVAELLALIDAAQAKGQPPITASRLRRYERARRSENALAAHAFDALNRLFSNDAPVPVLLRGPALGLVDRLAPLKHFFMRHAIGRV